MVVCMPSSYCWIYAICSLLENNLDTKTILEIQEYSLTIGDKGISSNKFQQICGKLGINLVVQEYSQSISPSLTTKKASIILCVTG